MKKIHPRFHFVSSTDWVRFLAIFLIVAGHFDVLNYGGGASYTMLVLAGVTYAKYVLPKLSVNAPYARRRQVLLVIKIGFPTLLYTILLQTLFSDGIDWRSTIFIANFYEPTIFSYWFIEVYLQINLVLLFLTLPKPSRDILVSLRKPIWACVVFIVAVALAWMTRLVWDTSGLYDRVPNQMFWFFAAGILYAAVDENKYHRWAFGVLVIIAALFLGKFSWLFFVAVTVMSLWHFLPAPRLLSKVVVSVAGASLMIYLTHFQWASLWHKLVPQGSNWGGVGLALLGGVFLHHLYGWLWGRVCQVLDDFLSRWPIFLSTPKS